MTKFSRSILMGNQHTKVIEFDSLKLKELLF